MSIEKMPWLLGVCSLAVLTAACGSDQPDPPGTVRHMDDVADDPCATATGTDTFSANMAKTGNQGVRVAIKNADPAPPALSDNAWNLRIEGPDGETLIGVSLKVIPWMTEHNHGSNRQPVITDNQDGTYTVERVNFSMPGTWDTTIEVESAGLQDEVQFSFCVE